MNTTPPNNPYAQAAGAYGNNAQKNAPDQRELEGRVLLKAASMLRDLQEKWDEVDTDLLESTLKYNRQIWMMFYDTAIENAEGDRPDDLRSNIINLANFIFKRETEILADRDRNPQKLDVLMNINKEIAAGLMGNKSQNAQASETVTQSNIENSETDSENKSADAQIDRV